jgi:hypothetical protein
MMQSVKNFLISFQLFICDSRSARSARGYFALAYSRECGRELIRGFCGIMMGGRGGLFV